MPRRSDAVANRAALLESAARLFASDGAEVALEKIAREAGVSIATLYRNFPSREDLVAETYGREIEQLGVVTDEGSGVEALRGWLARFVEFTRTKKALAEIVHAMPEGGAPPAREVILEALGRMLSRGADDGTLRADRDAEDVLPLLAGFWVVPDGPDWPRRAERLASLVVDGLRP